MEIKELEERVRKSLLFPQDKKDYLMNIKRDENTKKLLKDFFEKYWNEELEATKKMKIKATNIAVNSIKKLEKQYRENYNNPELEKILQKLKKI